MTDDSLRELYQEVIIDHGRHPRCFERCETATNLKEGHNPLCGDHLIIYLTLEGDHIRQISFQGEGCAISKASASLMCESLIDSNITEVDELYDQFHQLVKGDDTVLLPEKFEKLMILAGVAAFPARVKCATLAWHTMHGALYDSKEAISTE